MYIRTICLRSRREISVGPRRQKRPIALRFLELARDKFGVQVLRVHPAVPFLAQPLPSDQIGPHIRAFETPPSEEAFRIGAVPRIVHIGVLLVLPTLLILLRSRLREWLRRASRCVHVRPAASRRAAHGLLQESLRQSGLLGGLPVILFLEV